MTGRAAQIIPAGPSCNFIIRAYGRQELACLYFPMSSPRSAWRRLKGWIMLNPRLREALAPTGRMNLLRTLTPCEVKMIVEELGEP